jgi:signal peptidase I
MGLMGLAALPIQAALPKLTIRTRKNRNIQLLSGAFHKVGTMAFVVRLQLVTQLIACGALHAGSVEEAARCFRMESVSMLPTIAKNGLVSVVPYPNISNARRGDVVVFRHPVINSIWVQRLIGMPGDKIQMKEGRLYINGDVVEREPMAKIHAEDFYGRETDVPTYKETLLGGVSHTIIEIQGDSRFNDNTQVFEVPSNNYFMMGDNRDNSTDSRVPPDQGGVGYVPSRNIIGYVTAQAGVWEKYIELIDFLVDGPSYIGKRVPITGCQFSFARADSIACVAFKIAKDTNYPDPLGQVLIAGPSLERESLRRALRNCSDYNTRQECSGDVTGTVFDVFAELGAKDSTVLGIKCAAIKWVVP